MKQRIRKLLSLQWILTVGLTLGISPSAFTQDRADATTATAATLEPLILSAIECSGNTNTDCEILRREVHLQVGHPVDEEELENARIRLQLMGLFRSVSMSLKKGAERGQVIVNIDVVEGSPWFSETSIEAHSKNRIALSYKLGHRNLFGTGKILQGSFYPSSVLDRIDGTYNLYLEYIDPHLFGSQNYFMKTQLSGYFDNRDKAENYVSTRKYGSFGFEFGRRIFDFSHVAIGATVSESEIIRRDELTDPFEETRYTSSNYSFNYGWDSQDDPYFATEGSTFDANLYQYKERYGRGDFLSKQNFSLDAKNSLALYFNGSYDSTVGLSGGSALEWNHQFRRGLSDASITSSKLFLKPAVSQSAHNELRSARLELGAVFDTKSFGIIKLSAYSGMNL